MFPLKNVAAHVIAFEEDEYLERTLKWLSSRVAKVYLGGCKSTFMGTDKRNVSPVKVVAARLKSQGFSNIVFVDCGHASHTNPAINEAMARNDILKAICKDGIPWAWIVDSDEMYSQKEAESFWSYFFDKISENNHITGLKCKMRTYWRSLHWRVEPVERHSPLIIVRSDMKFVLARNLTDESKIIDVPSSVGMMTHYSWSKTPSEVCKKVKSWGHAHQLIPNWFENVFMKWKPACAIENLHPNEASAFKKIVRCDLPMPEIIQGHPYVGKDIIEDEVKKVLDRPRIKAVILNHNKPENSDKLFEQLFGIFDDVEIFDSGSDAGKIPIHVSRSFSNIYWTGAWNEIMRTCSDYDTVWMLGCDIELRDEPLKYRQLIEKSLPFGCWSPCIDGRALDFMSSRYYSHGQPKSVRCIEGMALAVSGSLMMAVAELPKGSPIGFGQDLWLCYMARQMGLNNVIDGRVSVFHPSGIGYNIHTALKQMEDTFSLLYGKGYAQDIFEWYDDYDKNLIGDLMPDSVKIVRPLTIVTVDNGWTYPDFVRITSSFPDIKKIVLVKGVSELVVVPNTEIRKYDGSIAALIKEADIAFFPRVGNANKAEFLEIIKAGIPTVVHADYDQKAIQHMVNGYIYRDDSWAISWLKKLTDQTTREAIKNKLLGETEKKESVLFLEMPESMVPTIEVKQPLVSVITPTYKRDAKIISHCIDCMKLQTVKDWEQLICSDGSEEEHVKELVRMVGDSRVSYCFTQDKKDGDYGNTVRSEMLKKARGRYVLFCDDDNLILPDYFEKMIKAIEDAKVDFAVCKVIHFGPLNESQMGKPPIVLMGNPVKLYHVDPLQILVKREVMLDIGWDTKIGYLSDGVTLEKLGAKYKHVRVESVLGIHV